MDHVNNGKYRDLINALLPRIAEDAECVNNAKDHLIDALNWKSYVNNFRRKLIKDPRSIYKTEDDLQELLSVLDKAAASNPGILDLEIPLKDPESLQAQSSLFSVTLASAKAELLTVINTNKILANTSDLRMPHEWYPYARLTKRKIYYHGGPTNSGKVRLLPCPPPPLIMTDLAADIPCNSTTQGSRSRQRRWTVLWPAAVAGTGDLRHLEPRRRADRLAHRTREKAVTRIFAHI